MHLMEENNSKHIVAQNTLSMTLLSEIMHCVHNL